MNLFARLFRRNELSCQQVEMVLQEYLDSELDPAEVPKVMKHLEACRDCGLEAEVYQRIKASLRSHQEQPGDASIAKLRDLAADLVENGLPGATPAD